MSTTSVPSTNPISRVYTVEPSSLLWRAGLFPGIAASAATTLTVVVAHAAGEPATMSGKQIPATAFATHLIAAAMIVPVLAARIPAIGAKSRSVRSGS